MTSLFLAKIPHAFYQLSWKERISLFVKKKIKMAEEFRKFKDILKREREEFQKQLVREVGTP